MGARAARGRIGANCLLGFWEVGHTLRVADSAEKIPLRVAVIGVGALGQHHARIYGELAREGGVELTGIFDANLEQARRIASEIGTSVHESIDAAIAASDALSVVTPTTTHFEIAGKLLRAGRHVLVEKPMTDTSEHATALVALAHEQGRVLQVGHVERFNPVLSYLEKAAPEPRFIETHRLSSYPKRSTDIGVVLDLMIHDLDVVLAFVKSPVVSVDAVGVPVLSRSEDIANARLRFANGCVANVTVSRVSPERLRKIRVFSGGESPSYISLDYQAQEGFLYRLGSDEEKESSLLKKLFLAKDSAIVSEFAGKKIVREPVPIEKEQPLKLELKHFVECVKKRLTPIVSGASAKVALDLAFEITEQIRALDGKK
ncbi:MAG: Gfo/Idh/MocA family oxidoreductase [Verrucomicrobiae bacterium]|nr:Gfo/Idh/MocA family oxidoreductase [Verrucomicrobiae bacterium]